MWIWNSFIDRANHRAQFGVYLLLVADVDLREVRAIRAHALSLAHQPAVDALDHLRREIAVIREQRCLWQRLARLR